MCSLRATSHHDTIEVLFCIKFWYYDALSVVQCGVPVAYIAGGRVRATQQSAQVIAASTLFCKFIYYFNKGFYN